MGKRGIGAVFCIIAALLFSSRYIAAAIFMSGVNSWSSEVFSSGLNYVGTTLLSLSIVSLIIGIAYLVWAEATPKQSS